MLGRYRRRHPEPGAVQPAEGSRAGAPRTRQRLLADMDFGVLSFHPAGFIIGMSESPHLRGEHLPCNALHLLSLCACFFLSTFQPKRKTRPMTRPPCVPL